MIYGNDLYLNSDTCKSEPDTTTYCDIIADIGNSSLTKHPET